MFTGIIEEIGIIRQIATISGGGKRITIQVKKIQSDLKIDDSVAVSGVCLTVTQILDDGFEVDAVGETLEKTTLNKIEKGQKVNLERAMRLSDRLGGHIVQGHVNGKGIVKNIQQRGENWLLTVKVPGELTKYLINEGSIAIDGISLTIANLDNSEVNVSVIPHTLKNTIISTYTTNQIVNIETDFLAKYIENFVNAFNLENRSFLTIEKLKEMGY